MTRAVRCFRSWFAKVAMPAVMATGLGACVAPVADPVAASGYPAYYEYPTYYGYPVYYGYPASYGYPGYNYGPPAYYAPPVFFGSVFFHSGGGRGGHRH